MLTLFKFFFFAETKNILSQLSDEDKKDEVVSHALKIAKAWSSNNYHRFFKLYISSPKMSSFIIDWFIERIRKTALKAIIKSYVCFLKFYLYNCMVSIYEQSFQLKGICMSVIV